MRLQASAVGAISALCGLFPGAAFAQATTAPVVEPVRQWRIGLRASAVHDTNVARSSSSLASLRGLTREDDIYTPQVTVSLTQPFGRQAVFVNGEAGYDFHRVNKRLDRQRTNVTGGVATVLGPCRQVAFASYRASQTELANLDLGNPENLQKTTSVALALECRRPVGPGLSVLVQRADTKNSQATLTQSDLTTETANISVVYSRPTLGQFALNFVYSDTEFPNRIIPLRPVGDGFFTQTYGVGYMREFGSRLKVNGSAALTHLKREFAPPGVDQSFTSSAYSADVTYAPARRLEFKGLLRREIMPSQQVGKTYDKRTSGEVKASYIPSARLRVSVGLVRDDVNSNVDTAAALLVVTKSRLDAVYLAAMYRPNDTFSLLLNVRGEQRDTNLPDFDYTSTRVGLTAEVNF